MQFKFNRSDVVKFLISEAVALKVGLPGSGAATTFSIKAIEHLLNNTAEIQLREVPLGKSDEFLNQHPMPIQGLYDREDLLAGRLLYVELVNFADQLLEHGKAEIDISIRNGLFSLAPFADPDVEALRTKGFERLRDVGKYTHNSDVIRVSKVIRDGTRTELEIQKAHYKHQARSNLILDFAPDGHTSIRQALRKENPGRLPALDDARLANTLGITVLVFYRNDLGVLCPFLVPRTRKVAVLNRGKWSDSASGAAEWPKDPETTKKTFEDYILDDLYTELEQEIGLLKSDLTELLPVALCRDLIRAGKPQLFFLGLTGLSRRELLEKMEEARKKARRNPIEPDEIFKMPLLRKPPEFESAAHAISFNEEAGVDPQCAASLYYALNFLRKIEGQAT